MYKRLRFLGNKMISQAVALLFLAVWHGYFIGYYICFMFELIIIQFELQVSSTTSNKEKKKKNTTLVFVFLEYIGATDRS